MLRGQVKGEEKGLKRYLKKVELKSIEYQIIRLI